jgi:hypothetical protein
LACEELEVKRIRITEEARDSHSIHVGDGVIGLKRRCRVCRTIAAIGNGGERQQNRS